MAQAAPNMPAREQEALEGAFSTSSARPEIFVSDPAAAALSPARALQETLGREFVASTEATPWPLRRTVALVIMSCGAFWTGVYFLVAALMG